MCFSCPAVPPTALNVIVSSSGTARAGTIYSLTCTVSKTVNGLINSPTANWTIGGVEVTNRNEITVSTLSTDTVITSTLIFSPLRTSRDGRFSCTGTLTSPALEVDLMHSIVEILQVQSELRKDAN